MINKNSYCVNFIILLIFTIIIYLFLMINDTTITRKEHFVDTETEQTEQTEKEAKQKKDVIPTINDFVEFEQNEDMPNKTYKYCIKYMDDDKTQFNHCQTINEKETPNLKSWQGSYSAVSEYLNKITGKGNLQDKKMVAFKNKDNLADWHLCDPVILQTIKTNVEKMPDNKDDLDINTAIEYGCGFMK